MKKERINKNKLKEGKQEDLNENIENYFDSMENTHQGKLHNENEVFEKIQRD